MSQPALRMKTAAARLGIGPQQLRQQLRALGGITATGRARPHWVCEGWLIEQHRQYHHPVTGWRWYTRIEITEPGLVALFGMIHRAA